MVQMDRRRVRGLLRPKLRDRPRQQPQHAAHPLKIAERRRLAGQGPQNFRMQRVTRPEDLHRLGVNGIVGQGFSVGDPEAPVGIDDGRNPGLVYRLEQSPAQDLDRLVLLGGVQERRLARGNALRFRHLIGDELVLFGIGVGGAAVLADRQGIDQDLRWARSRRP